MRASFVLVALVALTQFAPGASAGPAGAPDVLPEDGAQLQFRAQNVTLQSRKVQGHATHYAPQDAKQGGPISSCGKSMDDNTMGVALSQAGWDKFKAQGISQQDLCYKPIVITAPGGKTQNARIYDTCPPDAKTATCFHPCDIDLTTGLFSKLEPPGMGIFPVTWAFTDGTPSGCSDKGSVPGSSANKPPASTSSSPSSTAGHHGGNDGKGNQHKSPSSSSSSTPAPKDAPAPFDPFQAIVSAVRGQVEKALKDILPPFTQPPPEKEAAPTKRQALETPKKPESLPTPSKTAGAPNPVDNLEDMLKAIMGAVAH